MGTSIEFDRVAVEFEDESSTGRVKQQYLLVHETGSDNVLDHDGNIQREWNFYTIGGKANVIQELARAASEIERGMVRYQNGKTKTENYIKNWRKAIEEEAISMSDFLDQFPFAEFVVTHPSSVTELPDPIRDTFENVKADWRRTQPDHLETPIYKVDANLEGLRILNTMAKETSVWIDFR